jgi:hypothetical protein
MAQDLYISLPSLPQPKKLILIRTLVVNPCGGESFCGWNNPAERSICTSGFDGTFKTGKLCHSLPNVGSHDLRNTRLTPCNL